jgi:hypothetical protein
MSHRSSTTERDTHASLLARSVLVAGIVAGASFGCQGHIGDDLVVGGGTGPGDDAGSTVTATANDSPTSFACDANQQPAMDQLRALTTDQYLHTLDDLLTLALGSASAAAAVRAEPTVASAIALLPTNTPVIPNPLVAASSASTANATKLAIQFPDGGWLRADQSIQQSRVQAFYSIAGAIADQLTSDANLGTVVGSCALGAAGATDRSCLATFIHAFGSRVLRRPINDADVSTYEAMFDLNGPDDSVSNPAAPAYRDLLTGLLNAPEFLYFVEHGDSPIAGLAETYRLEAHELAARLSYHFWDTMPDDELWARAEDGTLTRDDVYQQQVERLFADPRARTTLDKFLADYFQTNGKGGQHGTGGLNFHNLANPATLATPIYRAFAGADLPTASLYSDMVADATALVDYLTWSTHGGISDLLESPLVFPRSDALAKIYGVPTWDGTSAPPAAPDGARQGLLTRALFLSAGLDTSPILKGVFVRRYLLCDTLGTPPAAAANAMVPLTTTQTTRQATTALTSGSPCNACHTRFINPLGFATENFDGLGRLRTLETLYQTDGSVATKLPVDTSVTPHVEMADDTTQVAGAADLMPILAASGKVEACLARSYYRYTFARFEDLSLDGCSLEPMRKALAGGGSLASLWKSVATTPAFLRRTYQ